MNSPNNSMSPAKIARNHQEFEQLYEELHDKYDIIRRQNDHLQGELERVKKEENRLREKNERLDQFFNEVSEELENLREKAVVSEKQIMDYKKKYEESNECIEVLGSEFKKAEAKCEELESSITKIKEIHQKDQQLLREKEVQYSEIVQKYQHITAKYEKKTAMYSVSIQEKDGIIRNLKEKVQSMEAASTTSQLNSTPPINLASELILTEKEEAHAKEITDVIKVNSTYVHMVRDHLAQQMADFENHIQQVTENSMVIGNNLGKMMEKYKKLYLHDVELKKKQIEQEKQIKSLEIVKKALEHEIQLLQSTRNVQRNNVSRRHTGNIRSPICHSTPKEPISRVSTMPVHPLPRPSIVKREESDDTLRRPVDNRPQTSHDNNVLVRPSARNLLNNEGSNRNPRHHWPSFLRSTESSNVSDTSNSTSNTLTPSNNRRSNSITRDHGNRFRKNNGRSASVTRDDQTISRMVFNSSNGSTSSKYPTLFHGTLGCDGKISERNPVIEERNKQLPLHLRSCFNPATGKYDEGLRGSPSRLNTPKRGNN